MLKVMIVDDSLIIRKRISKILENLGHKVISFATSGNEAIDMYKRFKPDLVTMDLTMPDMHGIEALKHIVEYDEHAKIIIVTSHGQEDMVIKSIQAGALSYILKPITEDNIAKVIGEIFTEYATNSNDKLLDFGEFDN